VISGHAASSRLTAEYRHLRLGVIGELRLLQQLPSQRVKEKKLSHIALS
jgi:hypothetical protein